MIATELWQVLYVGVFLVAAVALTAVIVAYVADWWYRKRTKPRPR